MTKRQYGVTAALSLAAFFLAFTLSSRAAFRLDLTRNKAFTLSKVSRELYRELPDPVIITYFISDRLDQAHPMPGEIADLLNEYAASSRGMIRFSRKDPAKANLTALMDELGIMPQQIQVVEKDEATVATVYTGILIEYLDKREVLPVAFSLDSLEYDISSRVRAMVRDKSREIGVIIGDSARDWQNDYGLLAQELFASGYKAKILTAGEEIPPGLPCLFVLGGAGSLDPWALYRIDHYIQGGGRALFAVDAVDVNTQGQLEAKPVEDAGLLAMLAGCGAVIRPVMVLDETALNLQFQTRTGNFTQIQFVRYPEWIAALPENSSRTHPITTTFQGIDLFWPSPLELHAPDGVEAEPLVASTPRAWLQTRDFITDPRSVGLFQAEAEATRGQKTLAAALSGVFPSAFAGKPKPEREGAEEKLPDMPAAPQPSRLIVVGDSDFAASIMQVTRSEARNLDFLLKAADWLSSDDDIIGIRNRRQGEGRLDKIQDPARRAALMAASRTVNVIVVPVLVALAGIFICLRRARSQRAGKTKEIEK